VGGFAEVVPVKSALLSYLPYLISVDTQSILSLLMMLSLLLVLT